MTDRPRGREDAGSITAMLVILSVCLLLMVIAVTDLSAAYLRRQVATSLADGAALAATQAAAAGSVYSDPDSRYVAIDGPAAAAAVRSYLARTGAYDDYPGLSSTVRVVGHEVQVFLVMPYDLPIPVPGVEDTALIHASSAAALPIYQ